METVNVNNYILDVETTQEQLELEYNPGYAAILIYGNELFFTDINEKREYVAAVYEIIELDPNEEHEEQPIRFKTAAADVFPDSGRAAEWYFNEWRKINKH